MRTIEKTFTGENRDQQVREYMKRYNPFGYGTHIVTKTKDVIVVRRESSCD